MGKMAFELGLVLRQVEKVERGILWSGTSMSKVWESNGSRTCLGAERRPHDQR